MNATHPPQGERATLPTTAGLSGLGRSASLEAEMRESRGLGLSSRPRQYLENRIGSIERRSDRNDQCACQPYTAANGAIVIGKAGRILVRRRSGDITCRLVGGENRGYAEIANELAEMYVAKGQHKLAGKRKTCQPSNSMPPQSEPTHVLWPYGLWSQARSE
jgi:hypothetical protein